MHFYNTIIFLVSVSTSLLSMENKKLTLPNPYDRYTSASDFLNVHIPNKASYATYREYEEEFLKLYEPNPNLIQLPTSLRESLKHQPKLLAKKTVIQSENISIKKPSKNQKRNERRRRQKKVVAESSHIVDREFFILSLTHPTNHESPPTPPTLLDHRQKLFFKAKKALMHDHNVRSVASLKNCLSQMCIESSNHKIKGLKIIESEIIGWTYYYFDNNLNFHLTKDKISSVKEEKTPSSPTDTLSFLKTLTPHALAGLASIINDDSFSSSSDES